MLEAAKEGIFEGGGGSGARKMVRESVTTGVTGGSK